MNMTGIVSIVFGVMIVCTRAPLVFAPASALGWFKAIVESNRGIRLMVSAMLPLGLMMMWAGASESSGLAGVLFIIGCFISVALVLIFMFPTGYGMFALAVLPATESESAFVGWRVVGLVAICIGGLFIYAGAQEMI